MQIVHYGAIELVPMDVDLGFLVLRVADCEYNWTTAVLGVVALSRCSTAVLSGL